MYILSPSYKINAYDETYNQRNWEKKNQRAIELRLFFNQPMYAGMTNRFN